MLNIVLSEKEMEVEKHLAKSIGSAPIILSSIMAESISVLQNRLLQNAEPMSDDSAEKRVAMGIIYLNIVIEQLGYDKTAIETEIKNIYSDFTIRYEKAEALRPNPDQVKEVLTGNNVIPESGGSVETGSSTPSPLDGLMSAIAGGMENFAGLLGDMTQKTVDKAFEVGHEIVKPILTQDLSTNFSVPKANLFDYEVLPGGKPKLIDASEVDKNEKAGETDIAVGCLPIVMIQEDSNNQESMVEETGSENLVLENEEETHHENVDLDPRDTKAISEVIRRSLNHLRIEISMYKEDMHTPLWVLSLLSSECYEKGVRLRGQDETEARLSSKYVGISGRSMDELYSVLDYILGYIYPDRSFDVYVEWSECSTVKNPDIISYIFKKEIIRRRILPCVMKLYMSGGAVYTNEAKIGHGGNMVDREISIIRVTEIEGSVSKEETKSWIDQYISIGRFEENLYPYIMPAIKPNISSLTLAKKPENTSLKYSEILSLNDESVTLKIERITEFGKSSYVIFTIYNKDELKGNTDDIVLTYQEPSMTQFFTLINNYIYLHPFTNFTLMIDLKPWGEKLTEEILNFQTKWRKTASQNIEDKYTLLSVFKVEKIEGWF